MKKYLINNLANCKFFSLLTAGEGTIFMLHRIGNINKNGIASVENLKISSEFLINIIEELKRLNYDFISLENLKERLQSKNRRKFAIFTFDDGYKDNFTKAYPIFKRYNIPFTIFVTSSFPNNQALLWWECLSDIIMKNSTIYTNLSEKFETKTLEDKERVFSIIKRKILLFNQLNLKEEIEKYLPYSFNYEEKNKKLCINWEELKRISKDPLVSIGAHTLNHFALNRLSKEDVINEILNNKRELEEKLNIKVNLFAYPFGDNSTCGKREFEIVKNLGFDLALTTRVGNIYKEHINYLHQLPRIALTQKYNLKARLYLSPLIINRGKRVIYEK